MSCWVVISIKNKKIKTQTLNNLLCCVVLYFFFHLFFFDRITIFTILCTRSREWSRPSSSSLAYTVGFLISALNLSWHPWPKNYRVKKKKTIIKIIFPSVDRRSSLLTDKRNRKKNIRRRDRFLYRGGHLYV